MSELLDLDRAELDAMGARMLTVIDTRGGHRVVGPVASAA